MIRRATEADLPEMRRVFDAARAYMAAQGNPTSGSRGIRRTRCFAAIWRAADCMCWRMIRGFTVRSRS